jgi:uncharacterized protein (DUF58 family)
VISRRGWLALGVGGVALLLSAYTLNLLLLLGAIVFFATIAAEMLLFEFGAPLARSEGFVGERLETPQVLTPTSEASAWLEVEYRGAEPIRAEVLDLVPLGLAPDATTTTGVCWWAPGQRRQIRYRIRAGARGSYRVGPLSVLVESPHGLAWVQRAIPRTERPIRVIPPAPFERSHRLAPGLTTRVQGPLALRHRGFGTEFRSLRLYQSNDDIRHIAWKRSRPPQLYVREFEQESRQDFLLLLDVTPAMIAGLPGENALDRAVEASALVTSVVARSGEDRVGLAIVGPTTLQYFAPARSARHLRLMIENLAYIRPSEGTLPLASTLDDLMRRGIHDTHVIAFAALDGSLDGFHLAHARFRARGNRLYLFPPRRAAFYPPLGRESPGRTALRWAELEEERRLDKLRGEFMGEGVPFLPYDRRGAGMSVLAAYGQIRAWGQL